MLTQSNPSLTTPNNQCIRLLRSHPVILSCFSRRSRPADQGLRGQLRTGPETGMFAPRDFTHAGLNKLLSFSPLIWIFLINRRPLQVFRASGASPPPAGSGSDGHLWAAIGTI
jgi:hypothetical protein